MRQVQVGKAAGLDHLTVADVIGRDPGPGEIQVRVHASSLNFHDYLIATGLLPSAPGRVLLSDAAGEVVALGDGVAQFAAGDRVISHFFPAWVDGNVAFEKLQGVPGDHLDGFAAQLVTMPCAAFSAMPQGMSYAEAATLPCAGLTAWRALMEEATLTAGDWVLVQGTGGVSVFALQIAKHLGCRVIATSSSAAKMERLRALGADEVLNYREQAEWGRMAAEISGGGVGLIVEVGGPGTVTQSVRALAVGGVISMIGVLTGISGEFPLAQFFQRNATMAGITVGSHEHQAAMIEAFERWQLKPVIDSHYPLQELAGAFRHQESQQHVGKIVVDLE